MVESEAGDGVDDGTYTRHDDEGRDHAPENAEAVVVLALQGSVEEDQVVQSLPLLGAQMNMASNSQIGCLPFTICLTM